jgi:hypothetical protein
MGGGIYSENTLLTSKQHPGRMSGWNGLMLIHRATSYSVVQVGRSQITHTIQTDLLQTPMHETFTFSSLHRGLLHR